MCFTSSSALAFSLPKGSWGLSIGGTNIQQGAQQLINIQSSFGNIYTVNSNSDNVFLIGVTFLKPVAIDAPALFSFGASAYYFSPASVTGTIFLERNFPNLSYHFETQNIPLYATGKAVLIKQDNPFSLVLDAGIGPNFMQTQNYYERSLDDGITIPNQTFKGSSTIKFSAMAGLGIKLNNLDKLSLVEFGYKYFYLGEGQLNPHTQVLNHLSTRTINAHALVLTLRT